MPDFWSRLSATSTEPDTSAEHPRSATGPAWWQVAAPPAPTAPEPKPPEAAPEPDENQSLSKTQWAKQPAQSCPSCGSSHYMGHPDQPSARPRCYDCGYPVTQSGSGLRLRADSGAPVQAARQTAASKTSDFNPQNIFHTLG